jgi:transketolase
VQDLSAQTRSIRENILAMLVEAGSGHPGGSLGSVEIFASLYFNVIKHDPKNSTWNERDRVLLSAGHICPVLYATLAQARYFEMSELLTLRKFGSRLQGHPEFRNGKSLPGIENTSGPLGQGLSQAIGIALSFKLDKKPNHVYCVMSDGEQQEGQTMESLLYAGSNHVDNLTLLIDRNNIQLSGNTKNILPLGNFRQRIRSFGWHVIEIDGNNVDQITNACQKAKEIKFRPTAIICHTIPGKGISFMENKFEWHGKKITKEDYQKAISEL